MDLAWWVEAEITRVDSHVYWNAFSCKRKGETYFPKELFFKDYLCSLEMFIDLIKKGMVREIKRKNIEGKSHFMDSSWEEIDKTLKACIPFLSIPLTDEALAYQEKYREPDKTHWYEVILHNIGEIIKFDFLLWGYKYKLSGLQLEKTIFYKFADRLNPNIRFLTDWSSLDEIICALRNTLKRSRILKVIEQDLISEINRLSTADSTTYESVTASMLRLLEKLLRYVRSLKSWQFSANNLDQLINGIANNLSLPDEQLQMLRLISKPYRDYVLHGHPLAFPVAKVLLATVIDLFVRLSDTFDRLLQVFLFQVLRLSDFKQPAHRLNSRACPTPPNTASLLFGLR